MGNIKAFLSKYKHTWLLCYSFICLPRLCYPERTVTRYYHVVHIVLDGFIPFNGYFTIPYMVRFLHVAGTTVSFPFRNKEDYYRVHAFLFSGTTISLIIYTFFHNGTDFRPITDLSKNVFPGMITALYQMDMPINVFPNIYVYNPIGTYIAITKSGSFRKHFWVQVGSVVPMVPICPSTVLLKQHSVTDMIGAAVVAYVVYGVVYGYSPSVEDRKVAQKVFSQIDKNRTNGD